jgi:hypothetical protein
MSSFKNIAAIVGISFSIALQPVASYAGGGLTGGALEITQLANNAELMAQVSEAAQQTAQQVNMLATMMQNLQSLGDLSGIAARLGIPTSDLQSFVKSYRSVSEAQKAVSQISSSLTRLQDNSGSMATFYDTLADRISGGISTSGGDGKITRAEIDAAIRAMDKQKVERTRKVMEQRLRTIEEMNNDYDFIRNNAGEISKITGNVQGLQFLASQQSSIQRLLMDSRMSIESLNTTLTEQRLESAEREQVEREIGRKLLERNLGRLF